MRDKRALCLHHPHILSSSHIPMPQSHHLSISHHDVLALTLTHVPSARQPDTSAIASTCCLPTSVSRYRTCTPTGARQQLFALQEAIVYTARSRTTAVHDSHDACRIVLRVIALSQPLDALPISSLLPCCDVHCLSQRFRSAISSSMSAPPSARSRHTQRSSLIIPTDERRASSLSLVCFHHARRALLVYSHGMVDSRYDRDGIILPPQKKDQQERNEDHVAQRPLGRGR